MRRPHRHRQVHLRPVLRHRRHHGPPGHLGAADPGDWTAGRAKWAATATLKAAGVKLFQNKSGTGVRKVHHKVMVIDERLVIAGSFNCTAPAIPLTVEKQSWSKRISNPTSRSAVIRDDTLAIQLADALRRAK